MSRTEEGLYQAIEQELKRSQEPMDCVDLFEKSAIRALAPTSNRVSDYLGNMWRRGLLSRLPAPTGTSRKARWLYSWKGKKVVKPVASEALPPYDTKKLILQRPSVEISESGRDIVIELPDLVITIKSKR